MNFGYLNPILEKLGVTHDIGLWLVEKPMVDFELAVSGLFFAISYGSGVLRRNVYNSAVFTGSRPLYTQILPGHGHPPVTILGDRKPETL